MDCHIGLCLGCHREKTAQYRNLALHNSTDFVVWLFSRKHLSINWLKIPMCK
jgi:hypothetical protein